MISYDCACCVIFQPCNNIEWLSYRQLPEGPAAYDLKCVEIAIYCNAIDSINTHISHQSNPNDMFSHLKKYLKVIYSMFLCVHIFDIWKCKMLFLSFYYSVCRGSEADIRTNSYLEISGSSCPCESHANECCVAKYEKPNRDRFGVQTNYKFVCVKTKWFP